uniref:Uncharacterized protein n=1 Tax=Rhizophora mucronata TaxID=61149 RepID=A0A2P2ITB6_RHIMU
MGMALRMQDHKSRKLSMIFFSKNGNR